MKRTLKEYLTKLTLETAGDWVVLLPLALFQAWNTPYRCKLTPLEILDGGQAPLVATWLNLEISQEGDQGFFQNTGSPRGSS